jgi:hypothetical protein
MSINCAAMCDSGRYDTTRSWSGGVVFIVGVVGGGGVGVMVVFVLVVVLVSVLVLVVLSER